MYLKMKEQNNLAFHPFWAGRVGDKGIVDREQDTVYADFLNAAQQRRVGKVAAGRDVKVFAERIAERRWLVAVT